MPQTSKEVFDQAEGRGVCVGSVVAEAHWHMERVENHARDLRIMRDRTMEHLITDEADFLQLLGEFTDAKNNLVQHNGYLPRQEILGSSPRVPGHVLEDNSVLPLLEPDGRFKKQARY